MQPAEWQGYGKKGTLIHCWWECKLVQPLWKTVWRFLKTLKIEPPYDLAIVLLGIYPQRYRCSGKKGHMHPNVHSSIVHNSQTVEGAEIPSKDEWIKKIWSIYTMEYYSAIKRMNTHHLN